MDEAAGLVETAQPSGVPLNLWPLCGVVEHVASLSSQCEVLLAAEGACELVQCVAGGALLPQACHQVN